MKKTTQHTLPRLAVMACPDYAGRHPFHDQRWLVTEGTTIERGHDPRPGEWSTVGGSLVAMMRDCEPGTTAEIALRCNAHAGLVEALRDCLTERGALAERSHEYALRRLDAINEIARAILATLEA